MKFSVADFCICQGRGCGCRCSFGHTVRPQRMVAGEDNQDCRCICAGRRNRHCWPVYWVNKSAGRNDRQY